jgi:hypothetical protein
MIPFRSHSSNSTATLTIFKVLARSLLLAVQKQSLVQASNPKYPEEGSRSSQPQIICHLYGRCGKYRQRNIAKAPRVQEKCASVMGSLVFFSGVTGIDVSTIGLDVPILLAILWRKNKVTSHLVTFLQVPKTKMVSERQGNYGSLFALAG